MDATKILTPRDFELIAKLKARDAAEKEAGGHKRRAADHFAADVSLQTDNWAMASVVDPTQLEGPHATRRRDLEARLASQRAGQMGRDDKAPGRKAGMSNREKEKSTKVFAMIQKKRSVMLKMQASMSDVRHRQKKHNTHLKKKAKQITKIRSRRKQGR